MNKEVLKQKLKQTNDPKLKEAIKQKLKALDKHITK